MNKKNKDGSTRKTRSDKGKKRRKPKAHGSAKRKTKKRRKNNPAKRSVYAPAGNGATGSGRRSNPSMFKMDTYTTTLPAATAGIAISRFAVKLAGPFNSGENNDEPGIEHAIAIAIGLQIGAPMLGKLLPGQDRREVDIAQIAGLGFMGDMFLWKRFLKDREWAEENLYLGDYYDAEDDEDDEDDEVDGFQDTTPLGETWQDNQGNVYRTAEGGGWALAGFYDGNARDRGNLVQDANQVRDRANWLARRLAAPTASLPGGSSASDRGLSGFQDSSPLAGHVPATMAGNNTFGYQHSR